ncbi:MAG: tetratricopeptide repeat protein [Candidatus Lindowbacteria bacterium]|nr:tetratricopeptide repeat protein [Candidatus Lindowbacteria bacterium]
MKTKALFSVLAVMLVVTSGTDLRAQSYSSQEMGEGDKIARARRMARSGQPTEAILILERFAETGPAERAAEAMFQKGWIQFSPLKQYEEAIATFERLVLKYPESEFGDDALYYGGVIAQVHLRNPQLAIDMFRRGYLQFPQGDFRFVIADKLTELKQIPATKITAQAKANRPVSPSGIPTPTVSEEVDPTPLAVRRHPPVTDVPDSTPMRPDSAGMITMQFEKAPIRNFIQWVAEVTGKNFIIENQISGNITIYSGRPIPFSEVYRVFLSILSVRGFAAVESGDVTKIVTRQKAVQAEIPIVIDGDAYLPTDRLITRIFQIESIPAASMQGMIRPFMAGVDQAVVNVETNNLIVTGPSQNLVQIAELIKIIDSKKASVHVRSYRIRHGKATTIVDKLNTLLSSLVAPVGTPAPTYKLVPDERTNTLYAVGSNELQGQIQALVTELDIDKSGQRIVQVFSLDYARADQVVAQLKSLLGLEQLDQAADFGGVVQTVLIADKRLNLVSVSTFAPRIVELAEDYIKNVDRAPSTAVRTTRLIRLQNARASELFELLSKVYKTDGEGEQAFALGLADKIMMSPDKRTNSLIITATSADWPRLEKLIKDLDVRKAQVLIDVVILETSLTEARSLGVTLTTNDPPTPGLTRIVGGSALIPPTQLAQGGLVATAIRGTTVGSAIQALLTSSKTNILQMPQILALDNEIAKISVGDLTPIVSSRSVSATNVQIQGNSSIFQNVDYKNIGLNLAITPSIGDQGDILMDLNLEVQNRSTVTEVGLPVFSNRSIESKIQVKDGDYVVLGGLLRTQDLNSKRATPWLSKLPILGALFRNTTSSEDKTVLLIFLRPRVLTDPERAEWISEEERLQFEAEARGGLSTQRSEMEKWLPRH